MDIERKFIDFKDLTLTEEGPGRISGYRSVFGEIDEGGDLVIKGFFADSIHEYMQAGFTTHSHDWDFDKVVGYPIDAKEDDYGFFVESEFHSTPDAQNVRTKSIERRKAGKRVGFSFGYSVNEKSYVEAKDYKDQLPLYIKPERLQANLLKAQKFDRIRILKKGEVIEDAIVTSPMNKLAMAAAVKSEEETKTIQKCKPEDMEPGKPWCLYSATGKLLSRHATRDECVAQEQAIEANKSSLPFGSVEINGKTIPTGGYGCHTCPAQFQKIEEAAEHGKICRKLNNEKNQKLDVDPPAGMTFEDHSQSVLAAVSELAERAKSIAEIRKKEGRAISTSRRTRLSQLLAGLTAVSADIEALLAETEPPPKEKEIDVDALRTQSLRMQSLALRTLV